MCLFFAACKKQKQKKSPGAPSGSIEVYLVGPVWPDPSMILWQKGGAPSSHCVYNGVRYWCSARGWQFGVLCVLSFHLSAWTVIMWTIKYGVVEAWQCWTIANKGSGRFSALTRYARATEMKPDCRVHRGWWWSCPWPVPGPADEPCNASLRPSFSPGAEPRGAWHETFAQHHHAPRKGGDGGP